MHTNGTRNARRLELEPAADVIADGIDDYRAAARHAFEGIKTARRGSPQELAAATLTYQRAELEYARRRAREVV